MSSGRTVVGLLDSAGRTCLSVLFFILFAGMAMAAPADSGLEQFTDKGEVEDAVTVSLQQGVAGYYRAKLAPLPIDQTVNESWQGAVLESDYMIRPRDVWGIAIGGQDIIFTDEATLDVSGLDPGRYAIFIWGCDASSQFPEDCRWLEPRVFEKVPSTRLELDTHSISVPSSSIQLLQGVTQDFGASVELDNEGEADATVPIVFRVLHEGEVVNSSRVTRTVPADTNDVLFSTMLHGETDGSTACFEVRVTCPRCDEEVNISASVSASKFPTGLADFCADDRPYIQLDQDSFWGPDTVIPGESYRFSVMARNKGRIGANREFEFTFMQDGNTIETTSVETFMEGKTGERIRTEWEAPDDLSTGCMTVRIDCPECRSASFTRTIPVPGERESSPDLIMTYKGKSYQYAGDDDGDDRDWYPLNEDGLIMSRFPQSVTVADGDYVEFRVNQSTGDEDMEIVRDGSTFDPFDEEYNTEDSVTCSQTGIIHQFSKPDDGQEVTVRPDLGEGFEDATVNVRENCGEDKSWTGYLCERSQNLVAVPLGFEQRNFSLFFHEMERFADGWAERSPLKERLNSRRLINLQYLEPEDVDDPGTSQCFFNLDNPQNSLAYKTMRAAQQSEYSGTYHRAVSIYNGIPWFNITGGVGSLEAGVEMPVGGCNPMDWKLSKIWFFGRDAAVASIHGDPAMTLYHEMGHSYGFCHNIGLQSGTPTCRAQTPTDPIRIISRAMGIADRIGIDETLDVPVVDIVANDEAYAAGLASSKMRDAQNAFDIDSWCPNERGAVSGGDVVEEDKIMNYCHPNNYFLGDPDEVGDETHSSGDYEAYDYLRWLYDHEFGWMGDPPDQTPLRSLQETVYDAFGGLEDGAADRICGIPYTCDSVPGHVYDGAKGGVSFVVDAGVGGADTLISAPVGGAQWTWDTIQNPSAEQLEEGAIGAIEWSSGAVHGTGETIYDGFTGAADYTAETADETGDFICENLWCP